ncbi:RNA-binding protein 44 isoform X1 [Peromyscus maniculatus bairdii]|uniref:RNA-binding protein 44 n=1 Tax=Peromyscus maniculatus bairdii TaxID=230844 RepID=A0A6I9LR48_PERMB|nr:RNA-binding protein 44 [Peromyscus maniculatus bairdii]
MQATAVVETDSDKKYHKNGGNLQKDKPYNNLKKESVFNGCNEVKLTFPDGEWDSLAAEQRASDKEISSIDKTDLSEPSFSVNQDTNVEKIFSQSSEFEDSIDYALLNETYSIHCSESKLKNENLPHLYSELRPEVHKKVEALFDIVGPQDNNRVGLERSHEISGGACGDAQKSVMGDDSQQEYHSAEQECISTYLPPDPAKTASTSSLDVSELKPSGCGIKRVGNLEDNHVKLESGLSASLEALSVFAQECSPHASTSQSSDMLKEYHQPKFEKCKEQEAGLLTRKVFEDILQRSSSPLNPQKGPQTTMLAKEVKSQTIERKDFCGSRVFQNKTLQRPENPISFPQDQAPETQLKANNTHQTSGASIFDDSVISLCGSLQYKSLPEPGFFSPVLPRVAVTDNQAEVEDSCIHYVKSGATNKACSPDVKEGCLKSVPDAASCLCTVPQTLDVSRGANARSSVVSTSSNTEITVKRHQPDVWQSEKQSVACNTDWSCGRDCRDAQVPVPKESGRSLLTDCLNSRNENSLELRKTSDTTDRKKCPERAFQLCEEMTLPSKCCEKTVERAVKAEMHLLDVCYQMCRRHCCHIHKLVMESRAGFNRNLPSNSAKKELGSTLLSVLGDLKVRYMNLKEKVHKGIPLEELPPLSMESKLLAAFSDFASGLMEEEACGLSGANSELDNQSVPDVDTSPSLQKTLSQMSFVSDNSHLKQDKSPMNDEFKNGDINIDFTQLKLDDKDYKSVREVSEDWFDATERLTGIDFSGTQESGTEHDRWSPKSPLEMKNGELLRRSKGFLIHVGGLCPSVSEADLRSHFQKYQVSEISIYDSTNYRYASLAFTKNSNAKMAVQEMNGIEINGKSVNVRLVKIPGEHTPPLLSKNGNGTGVNHLEKMTNKDGAFASSTCRLPRARPRQPESEQDSEFPPLEQGVKKNCNQIESARLLPETPVPFIPPNTLNLRSFTKIMKKLAELHPEISRDHIIEALQEVRINHKGFLNGLSINTIIKMTSSFLRNSASR